VLKCAKVWSSRNNECLWALSCQVSRKYRDRQAAISGTHTHTHTRTCICGYTSPLINTYTLWLFLHTHTHEHRPTFLMSCQSCHRPSVGCRRGQADERPLDDLVLKPVWPQARSLCLCWPHQGMHTPVQGAGDCFQTRGLEWRAPLTRSDNNHMGGNQASADPARLHTTAVGFIVVSVNYPPSFPSSISALSHHPTLSLPPLYSSLPPSVLHCYLLEEEIGKNTNHKHS